MDLKTFKDEFLLQPEQTIIIDRPFELNGDEMHLLALTYKNSSYSLWAIDCMFDELGTIVDTTKDTIRDSIKRNKMYIIRSIESLEVAGNVFEFNGASTEAFICPGNQVYNRLQYFIDQGIELSHWDDVSLSKMQLTEFRCSESVAKVNLELSNKEIKLKFRPDFEEKEVFYKYALEYNLHESVELTYDNPFENCEESFFVQSFETYSLEKYIAAIESNEKYKDIPKEHVDRMIDMTTNYFNDLKDQKLSLVLMSYESDSILHFLLTEYLDRKVDHSSRNNKSSLAFLFKPENEKGKHGKKLFTASFLVNSKDGLANIEFELHSVLKKRQEEIILV